MKYSIFAHRSGVASLISMIIGRESYRGRPELNDWCEPYNGELLIDRTYPHESLAA